MRTLLETALAGSSRDMFGAPWWRAHVDAIRDPGPKEAGIVGLCQAMTTVVNRLGGYDSVLTPGVESILDGIGTLLEGDVGRLDQSLVYAWLDEAARCAGIGEECGAAAGEPCRWVGAGPCPLHREPEPRCDLCGRVGDGRCATHLENTGS